MRTALEQDYPNLEVVVADDGSVDGTTDVILEFGQKYPGCIVPIVGGVNLGITGNCNRGLKHCKGKYIAFMGGDDIFYSGKISKQVAWMEADSTRVICGHDIEAFDSNTGKILGIKGCGMPNSEGEGAYNIIKYGPPSFFGGSSLMVRRDAIPSFGFDERLPVAADWKFIIDCVAKKGKYGTIEGSYAGYRKHGGSITDVARPAIYGDSICTIGLIEYQYPEYLYACKLARILILYKIGIYYVKTGEKNIGLTYLFASAGYSSLISKVWKYPIYYLLALLSSNNVEKLRKLYLEIKIYLGLKKHYF